MSNMAIPQAPADSSGGFMVIQYQGGGDTHRMRIHVPPFSLTEFVVSGTPETYGSDDGHHNYAYEPHTPTGAEMGVNDTFQAFVNAIKPLFASGWVFSLQALYQVVNNVASEVPLTPSPSTINGTSATGMPVGLDRCMEELYNMKTQGGHRARLVFVGRTTSFAPSIPYTVTTSSGGAAAQQAVMAYLNNANSQVVGHDGARLVPSAHVTTTYNRRLRRKYGYA